MARIDGEAMGFCDHMGADLMDAMLMAELTQNDSLTLVRLFAPDREYEIIASYGESEGSRTEFLEALLAFIQVKSVAAGTFTCFLEDKSGMRCVGLSSLASWHRSVLQAPLARKAAVIRFFDFGDMVWLPDAAYPAEFAGVMKGYAKGGLLEAQSLADIWFGDGGRFPAAPWGQARVPEAMAGMSQKPGSVSRLAMTALK